MKTVKITAQPQFLANGQANPNAGKVFTFNPAVSAKDGQQYGYFRVESNTLEFDGPVARVTTRSALKTMLASDFEKVKDQLTDGTKLNGQIIAIDSLVPAYEGQPNLKAPVRGEDGKFKLDEKGEKILRDVTSEGKLVYRSTIFTSNQDSMDAKLIYDQVAEVAAPAVAEKSETVLAQ